MSWNITPFIGKAAQLSPCQKNIDTCKKSPGQKIWLKLNDQVAFTKRVASIIRWAQIISRKQAFINVLSLICYLNVNLFRWQVPTTSMKSSLHIHACLRHYTIEKEIQRKVTGTAPLSIVRQRNEKELVSSKITIFDEFTIDSCICQYKPWTTSNLYKHLIPMNSKLLGW